GDRVGTPRETMTPPTWSLRRLHGLDDAHINGLADVLIDCVEGGASVSFMHPLTRDRAVALWRRVAQGVAAGERAAGRRGRAGPVRDRAARVGPAREPTAPRRPAENVGASPRPPPGGWGRP